jgi:hypothetical protein
VLSCQAKKVKAADIAKTNAKASNFDNQSSQLLPQISTNLPLMTSRSPVKNPQLVEVPTSPYARAKPDSKGLKSFAKPETQQSRLKSVISDVSKPIMARNLSKESSTVPAQLRTSDYSQDV